MDSIPPCASKKRIEGCSSEANPPPKNSVFSGTPRRKRAAGAARSEVARIASSEVDFVSEVIRFRRIVKFAPMAQVVDEIG